MINNTMHSQEDITLPNHTLENMENDDKFTTLITDPEYCPIDFDLLNSLIHDVEQSWECSSDDANVTKGRTLEDLSVYLLSCVEPFDVQYDYKTPMNQLDAIIEVLAFRGNNNFLSEIGSIFCAECKNEIGNVDITHVEKIGAIMHQHHTNLTILFSRNPLTGLGKYEAAQGYVYTLYVSVNKRILNITYQDIKEMAITGTNFLTHLRKKSKDLRFLQLKTHTIQTELRNLKTLKDDEIINEEEFLQLKQLAIQEYAKRVQ